jgi:ATP-dependent Clp protease ATP-binding subunit ClpA
VAAAAREARALAHESIGTTHLLAALARADSGDGPAALRRLGLRPGAIRTALGDALEPRAPAIDPAALAALGIDLEAVRERIEARFGPGALEEVRAGCLAMTPRAKQALALALARAGDAPVGAGHVLVGLLGAPDSTAARALAGLGVDAADVERAVLGTA